MNDANRLRVEIVTAAAAFSISPGCATEIANRVVDRLGIMANSPKSLERTERTAKIQAEFNGRNQKELMRKYQISRSTLYRVLNER